MRNWTEQWVVSVSSRCQQTQGLKIKLPFGSLSIKINAVDVRALVSFLPGVKSDWKVLLLASAEGRGVHLVWQSVFLAAVTCFWPCCISPSVNYSSCKMKTDSSFCCMLLLGQWLLCMDRYSADIMIKLSPEQASSALSTLQSRHYVLF